MIRHDDFSEFFSGGTGSGSIRDAARPAPAEHEAAVAAYLRSGRLVLDVMEKSPDVIDGREVRETGSLLTDGSWYWREDLAHYIEAHHVVLRSEFMRFLEARQFRGPDLTEQAAHAATAAVIADWSS